MHFSFGYHQEALWHTIYSVSACYVVPVVIIFALYFYVSYRLIRAKRNPTILNHSLLSRKHNLEVLRNIVILLIMFLLDGLPIVLSIIAYNNMLYLSSLAIETFSVALSSQCSIVLDRELRQVVKNILS